MYELSEEPFGSIDEASAVVARQKKEIEQLKSQLKVERFAQELRHMLISLSTVGSILSPFSHSHLLEMVVQTACDVIHARSGSLFLIDEESQELVFEVALGPAGHEVKKFRVPIGHGIVGLVTTTGQPMAIANAKDDKRMASDIASSVNYLPESILCVPLFYDEKVIGALELLDKMGATAFSPADIETLGQFANIAAVAIAQSQAYKDQYSLLSGLLRAFKEIDPLHREQLFQDAYTFSNWVNTSDTRNIRAREIAALVNTLVLSDEQNSELCKSILQSIVTHINRRNEIAALANGRGKR